MLLPPEIHVKIASYLEPRDLVSYSLVSKECRACALEHMVFAVYDSDKIRCAVGAGARKLSITLTDKNVHILTLQPKNIFTKIVELNISHLQLVDLPVLPPALKKLVCHYNKLTTLPHILPSTLEILWCGNNQLVELPILPPTLLKLGCNHNQLTQLPTLPSTLVELCCSSNPLTQLPILPSTLVTLYCLGNQLTQLPPILPPTLTKLDCSYNNFFLDLVFIVKLEHHDVYKQPY